MATGIGSPLALGGLYPSVDGRYVAANGKPFTSVSNAESALNGFPSKLSESCVGLTVLVKESGWTEAKEYWVQPKGTTPETYGLVEKGAGTTDYADLDNKPTISDGGQGSAQIPLSGNVKVTATAATSGQTTGVVVTAGQNGEINMAFTLEKGADGANGTNGTNGTNGIDGKSAYQQWLDEGNTGDETDFLNSLKAQIGKFIYAGYNATAAALAIGGTTTVNLVATGATDDSIVLMPNDDATAGTGDPTATMMFSVSVSDDPTPVTTYTYIGDVNVDASKFIGIDKIVNDPTTGGVDKVLGAEGGKRAIREAILNIIPVLFDKYHPALIHSTGIKRDGTTLSYASGNRTDFIEIDNTKDLLVLATINSYYTSLAIYSTNSASGFLQSESEKDFVFISSEELQTMGAQYIRCTVSDTLKNNGKWFVINENLQKLTNEHNYTKALLDEVSTYYHAKLSVNPTDRVLLAGDGGTSYPLWRTFNTNGEVVRTSGSNVNNIGNPLWITIQNDECSIEYHTSKSSYDKTNCFITLEGISTFVSTVRDYIADRKGDTNLQLSLLKTAKSYISAEDGTPTITATSLAIYVKYTKLAGVSKVKVKYSGIKGGGKSKYGYYFYDETSNVLKTSSAYASGIDFSNTQIVSVPNGATGIVVSDSDGDASVTIVSYSDRNIIDNLIKNNNKIKELDTISADIKETNLCTKAFTDYIRFRYNNGDYSYTKESYAGALHSSYEQPIPVTIPTELIEGVEARKLVLANNSRFLDNIEIQLDLASTTYTLVNLVPNTIYYYKVYNDDTVTNSGKINTSGCSVRWLKIENNSDSYIPNVRDIGGWKTEGNKIIQYGKIIRGEELNSGQTINISTNGISELKRLGVGAELDLRGSNVLSESILGSDVEYYGQAADLLFYRLNPYHIDTLASLLVIFANCIRQIIKWLTSGKGVYVHCQGGCDRTGALIAFIQGICGVSENDINHDYEISDRSRAREYYTIYKGDSYDGDFKFAMEFIKGLFKYQGEVYTWCRNYTYSSIVIDNETLSRNNTITNDGVKYCVWTNGTTTYYTTDIYPDSNSIIYNSSFVAVEKVITTTNYQFYFKVTQGEVYTWRKNYMCSSIVIDDEILARNNTTINNGIKYYVWTNGTTTYYTIDIYPDSNSIVYNSSFAAVEKVIADTNYEFYCKVPGTAKSSSPISDVSLINSLKSCAIPSLKEQFRILLGIGGLTEREMYILEMLLTS